MTEINEVANTITISWQKPSDNGTPITAYRIKIRTSDLDNYVENLVDCDGTKLAIITSSQCTMTVQKLMQTPYSLSPGTSVFVKVSSINVMGESALSTAGNGAILKLSVVPDAPIALARNDEYTWSGQATVTWNDAASDGG